MRELYDISDGWLVVTDPDDIGTGEGWQNDIRSGASPVPVPGVFQQTTGEYHGIVWHYREISLPQAGEDEDMVIGFGAVDYKTTVFINGENLHTNFGSENPFDVFIPREYCGKTALIALRIVNPREDREIDGLIRSKVPSRNIYPDRFRGGSCYNGGGITQKVTLKAAPKERIDDIFVRSDPASGVITADITLSSANADGYILDVGVRLNDSPYLCLSQSFDISAGEVRARVSFKPEKHLLWSLEEPNIYTCSFSLSKNGVLLDSRIVNTGFREFVVKDGFFFLNGKRIYLKSAHTGNHLPIGINAPAVPGMEFKDFQLAKASGFNCIRYIATMPTPAQLDFCDRLGLMIYEECYASWCLADSPDAEELYRGSVFTMIRRDRNHPCVTIWGLLNETVRNDAFRAAKDILPDLRKLDDTRLVLLNSGRWDLSDDGSDKLGSASNPGSEKWENVWGSDGTGSKTDAGDFHSYMQIPLTKENTRVNRECGAGSRPVFMSETGVGSQLDIITINRHFERLGVPDHNPDRYETREIEDMFLRDWRRFGCGDIFADPVDFLAESNRYNAETRKLCFDVIRSNPRICGYNVTGLLDHALCGEGPITYFRDFKPGNFDAFADGFSPLRWCLFTDRSHIYRGEKLELKAVLANEDFLPDGRYNASVCVTDDGGRCLMRGGASFTLPVTDKEGYQALAFPVYKKTVAADLPAGRYHLKAYLDHGGVPAANDHVFYVSERPSPRGKRSVFGYSLDKRIADYLESLDVEIVPFDIRGGSAPSSGRILAGRLDDSTKAEDARRLLEIAAGGASVVFLDRMTFADGTPASGLLPLKNCHIFRHMSWLYHHDQAVKDCRLTDGLKHGFMDWEWYDDAWPDMAIDSETDPDNAASVLFMVGNIEWETGRNSGHYIGGVTLAEYTCGKGKITLTTFPLIDNIGTPACDRILYNLTAED